MKKITMVLSSLLIAATMNAQVKMPAPSPGQTIKQDFALGTIEVKYSRPVAKGRKVFGDLVPFNKLWRTGANAATIIKFTDAVEIKGKRIDTGSYALYNQIQNALGFSSIAFPAYSRALVGFFSYSL